MLKVDDRLKAVADSIVECNVLADIGSDHGYLPIFLLQSNKIDRAIVTDINFFPLENSKVGAEKYLVAERCDFRLGGGLEPLRENEADHITICGMGADTICDILRDNLLVAKSAKMLILQPMTNQVLLAKFLGENGFEMVDVKMVRDRHLFYTIYIAKPNPNVVSEDELSLEFPKVLHEKKDNIYKEYLIYKLKIENNILSGVKKSCTEQYEIIDKAKTRIDKINKELSYYED